jgi:hypothetical protein
VNEIDALRSEIQDLHHRHERGDIPSRRFEHALAERSLDLYRAVARECLGKGESLLAEHHVIHSHLRLSQSILKEADQQAVSLFGTDRRLLRIRSILSPGRPVTCDSHDQTVLDKVPYSSITGFRVHREVRRGEAVAGVVICTVAWVFRPWLEVTGGFMIGLGVVAILHALLLPTRWIEVETLGAPDAEPIKIHAPRKKSARSLLRLLRKQRAAARSR